MTLALSQTCLLVSGISESNCASWVQAWGSLGALAGVGATLWWQDRSTKARARAERLELRLRHLNTAFDLVAGACGVARALCQAPQGPLPDNVFLVRVKENGAAIHKALSSLSPTDFEGRDSLQAVIAAASALGTLLALLDQSGITPSRLTLQRYTVYIEAENVFSFLVDLRDCLLKELIKLEQQAGISRDDHLDASMPPPENWAQRK